VHVRLKAIATMVMSVAAAVAACLPSFEHLDDGVTDVDPGPAETSASETAPPGDDAGPDVAADVSDGAGPLLPVSCQDAKDRGFRTTDGDVTIDPNPADTRKPFVVFCKDMAAVPHEFLTLVNTTDPTNGSAFASGTNVSGWAMGPGGGTTSCLCPPDVVRAFTRVRLKITATTVKIDVTDTTFSRTNRAGDLPSACDMAKPGSCQALSPAGSRFGTAACCIEGSGALGRANVDLRGTVFSIASTEVGRTEGNAASGTTMYLTDPGGLRKQAEMHGGGSCGFQLAGKTASEIVLEQDAQ
jgi:GON domain